MNWFACPFCNLPQKRVFLETETMLAFLDAYAVTGWNRSLAALLN
jgi:hypothetical protein